MDVIPEKEIMVLSCPWHPSPVTPMTCVEKGSNPPRGDVVYRSMLWSATTLPASGPGIIFRNTRGIVAKRIRSKYTSVEDVALAGSTAAVHSVQNASRSETIFSSLDVIDTSHKYFPKDTSSLGTLGGDR